MPNRRTATDHPIPVARRGRRSAAALALGTALALALSGCVVIDAEGRDDGHDTMHDATRDASSEPGEFAQADVMFAKMMIPHHEQAIEMSDLVLDDDGTSPEVVELAEQIKAAQGPEIELMESWLDEWGMPRMRGDGHAMGGMAMDGMLSDAEMDELEAAEGPDAERLFLEGMIEHHEGAIEMAERHQEDGENAEVLALSASIITSQTAEIERMEELLAR